MYDAVPVPLTSRMGNRYWHVVITRFSYRSSAKDEAARRRAADDWGRRIDPLDPRRLELRFAVFEATCAPSLASQTTRKFDWLIIIDKGLSPAYRARLLKCVDPELTLYLHEFCETDDLAGSSWLENYAPENTDYLVTTLLDDDDALPSNFIENIHSNIEPILIDGAPPLVTVGSKSSVQWELIFTRRAPLGYSCIWHRSMWVRSAGFSLMCRRTPQSVTVLGLDHILADVWFEMDRGGGMEAVLRSRWGKDLPAGMSDFASNAVSEFQARARPLVDASVECMKTRGARLFIDVSGHTSPVTMTNHFFNDQLFRLLELKRHRSRVIGRESFPDTAIKIEPLQRAGYLFRKRWSTTYAQLLGHVFSHSSGGRSRALSALWSTWRFLRL
jgi:hypothetical protein